METELIISSERRRTGLIHHLDTRVHFNNGNHKDTGRESYRGTKRVQSIIDSSRKNGDKITFSLFYRGKAK